MDIALKNKIVDCWLKYNTPDGSLSELFEKIKLETGATTEQILLVSHILNGCHYKLEEA